MKFDSTGPRGRQLKMDINELPYQGIVNHRVYVFINLRRCLKVKICHAPLEWRRLVRKHSSKHRLHSISTAPDQDGSERPCRAVRHLTQSEQGILLCSETPWEEFLPRAVLRPAACQE